MGSVFRAAALSRFARTLGTLVKSGIPVAGVEDCRKHPLENRVLAKLISLWPRRRGRGFPRRAIAQARRFSKDGYTNDRSG